MKVLFIYSSECWEDVDDLRDEVIDRFGKSTVLRIKKTSKSQRKNAWHRDAIKKIKAADTIVYVVSKGSDKNPNVEWEIKQSMANNKNIVCYKLTEDATVNKSLEGYSKRDNVKTKEEIFSIIDDYNNDAYIHLTNENCDTAILLEQYKIFSGTAESLVERRQNMNSFYISANTALITIGATTFALSEGTSIITKLIIVLALSIPGILLNVSWRRIMQSYYLNNKGKIKVLSMMEKHLAASSYDAEWKAMKNKYSKEKYISFTDNEKKLPLVFILCYMLADISAAVILFTTLFPK